MNHPPTDDETLSGGRKVVAWLCLALFILLFMPTPFALYEGKLLGGLAPQLLDATH